MNNKLPQTDSIKELASFWDSHDLTDFDDELEEVAEPVFEGNGAIIRIPLSAAQAAALQQLAQSRGVNMAAIVLEWVDEHMQSSSS